MDTARVLGGDYMISVCWDEISTRPAYYMGRSSFIQARRESFPTAICLDFHTFSFKFFCKNVLINIFAPLRWAEAITLKGFYVFSLASRAL